MPVVLDADLAAIEVTFNSGQPRVTFRSELGKNQAFWNLTVGFNPNPDALQGAFGLKGSVPFTSGSDSELAAFKFGFLQFMRVKDYRIGWAGRRFGEGSILLDLARVIGRTNLLDCVPATTRPFFTPPVGRKEGQNTMTATMGDHPYTCVGDQVHNDKTGFDNFLFFIRDSRVATSVFVAQGPDGRIRPLAHVQFFVDYEMELRWTDKGGVLTPSVASNQSRFQIGEPAGGPPPENLVPRALLTSAGPATAPIANEVSRQAMKSVSNFQLLETHFFNVPEGFFT
jgi:hypothetical protein